MLKEKKRDYELEILEARFEIAKIRWEKAGETKESIKMIEKEYLT
jgi:hypothetical protein